MQKFRLAAEQGLAEAQTWLGVMYEYGKGVSQDDTEAMRWYTKAAAQGDAGAQTNLGGMYSNGDGVTKDYVHAYKWYSIAAANGYDDAATNRDNLAREMTPDQMAEGQRLAREWQATH